MKLNFKTADELAGILGTTPRALSRVINSADHFYEDCVLIDPARPDNNREIVKVEGELRRLQEVLYHRVLKPGHKPTCYSHGGIKSRNIKTNISPHCGSQFILTRDIQDFFPSISDRRIHTLFKKCLLCSEDVARILTRLCTYRHHLAQGLITSPILADYLMMWADKRIGAMCDRVPGDKPLVYTRYVDDLTISARFSIESGTFPKLVDQILKDSGFTVHPKKKACGPLTNQVKITKIRIHKGRPDIHPDYLADLKHQISKVGQLQHGGNWDGLYYTPDQILGRIHYVGWINPAHTPILMAAFKSFDWKKVECEAKLRGLERVRKKLVPKLEFDRGKSEVSSSVE